MPEADPPLNTTFPDPTLLATLQAEVEKLRRSVAGLEADLAQRVHQAEERQRLHEHQLQSQKRESLSVLAGGIAHDFNNLLTIILGNISLLEMTLLAGEGRPLAVSLHREYLNQVTLAAGRAADLCQQMLAFSGRGHFSVANLDLNRLLVDLRDSLEAILSESGSLRFRVNPVPVILADKPQMRQLLTHLVKNAAEALEDREGQITISTRTLLTEGRPLIFSPLDLELPAGSYVMLEVADTGNGIDEEIRTRIFDPFFSTKFTGRGLGLAAVLGIVRGHHGFIEVESQPGQGSVFRLFFPVSPFAQTVEQAQAPSAASDAQPAEADWHGEGTIWIVDDEAEIRGVASYILQAAGFRVQQASSGADALEQLRQPPADLKLVLLDLTMPQMDGVETFRQLRELHPALPVILMSGYSQTDVESHFPADRPADFLQKPFGRADLLNCVRRVLFSAAVATG